MTSRVVILFRYIPQYRREFYELLRERLAKEDIELSLVYGDPGKSDAKKNDAVEIVWGKKIKNKIIPIAGKDFYWQPVLGIVQDGDLVILEQATRMLVNYPLLVMGKLGKIQTAFWAHGRNFQEETATFLGEWIKRRYSLLVNWWFAYNRLSADVVARLGFPRERITCVQNTLNSRVLYDALQSATSEDKERYRRDIGIEGQHVGLYIGSMYKEKRIEYLLEACEWIRHKLPDFEMIFVGSGVDDILVKEKSKEQPWIHYAGSKFDLDKIPYFSCAQMLLIPGAVGLVVLDSFASGIPLITCENANHGPEIAYLEDGVNGIVTRGINGPEEYAKTVVNLFSNPSRYARLVKGCDTARREYTIENMVDRFAEGVCLALNDAARSNGARNKGLSITRE